MLVQKTSIECADFNVKTHYNTEFVNNEINPSCFTELLR